MAGRRLRQLVAGDCACEGDGADCGCVVIDGSLAMVILSLLGPVVLVALPVLWLVAGGPAWVWVLLAIGAALFGVVLFDMPVSSAFSARGVTRRTPLRDHVLPWDDIESLELTRSSRRPGVVARVGGRRYLLADRVALGPDQLDLLARMRPSDPPANG